LTTARETAVDQMRRAATYLLLDRAKTKDKAARKQLHDIAVLMRDKANEVERMEKGDHT
jgi:hypothetical protein